MSGIALPFLRRSARDGTHPLQWRFALSTPGEFDLLDARSLIERGDYTGAARRTVTAIEAVLVGTQERVAQELRRRRGARDRQNR